jgi:hypothetical protein
VFIDGMQKAIWLISKKFEGVNEMGWAKYREDDESITNNRRFANGTTASILNVRQKEEALKNKVSKNQRWESQPIWALYKEDVKVFCWKVYLI